MAEPHFRLQSSSPGPGSNLTTTLVCLAGLIALGGPAAADADPRAPALVRPFTLFGWAAPPVSFQDDARMREYAEAGFDLMLTSVTDSGKVQHNLDRLRWAENYGVRCLVWDERFAARDSAWSWTVGRLDSIANTYRNSPAFAGYYLGDEPPDSLFETLGWVFDEMRDRDTVHPSYNNLLPRLAFPTREAWLAHMRRYIDATHPVVISNSHYEFRDYGNAGKLVENVEGLASVAREYDLPFWGIVQLTGHWHFRPISEGELSWQVGTWLSYGARGIGYFLYWQPLWDPVYWYEPGMIGRAGDRGQDYERVRRLNVKARAVGEALAGLEWNSTQYTGFVPQGGEPFSQGALVRGIQGRVAIGRFTAQDGTVHALVLNRDSLAAQTVALDLDGCARPFVLRETGSFEFPEAAFDEQARRLELALDPGDFVLLRFDTRSGPGCGAARPSIEPFANPASGGVRFRIGMDQPGVLEIVDVRGRVVWSNQIEPGEFEPMWNGTTRSGGAAQPGIYHVRVRNAAGQAVRRLVWLGRR